MDSVKDRIENLITTHRWIFIQVIKLYNIWMIKSPQDECLNWHHSSKRSISFPSFCRDPVLENELYSNLGAIKKNDIQVNMMS